MRYLKFSAAEKLSTDLLRAYLAIFEQKDISELFTLSRTDIVNLVNSAELRRRPKRSFTFVLGVDNDRANWYLFDQENLKNGGIITAKSVEEAKI